MIYAELKDIKIYKGINKNLDKAIDFIVEKKYLNANFGKNIVEENTIYFDYPEKVITRENIGLELEYHKKYIDIHIVLEGEEAIAYTPFEDCIETQSYDTKKDIAFMTGKTQAELILNTKNFLILFPKEPHLPLLKVSKIKDIKKLVFKIEI
ncbi:YhcH/YjgK/YiaL family protein [Fusobacterium simiae]|uniref:YhcH/YjgK/YiaL family protein n=1 Tax=Fusobacterium simiae TaxID=855 RepID=A0ABT4DIC2_FUSSI|nr:YhcH/YjgK/YiaL family protein [Fusobacterium simiae]MCY7007126.1 YhcH/YjgK/YiaL family protein [Fusobacterium simiae]